MNIAPEQGMAMFCEIHCAYQNCGYLTMLNSWPLAKDLQVLVEIVHSGSFSAAAATLGQTPAFVTKRIKSLKIRWQQLC